MYRYSANGFKIISNICLPQLPDDCVGGGGADIDILVKFGTWSRENFRPGEVPYVRVKDSNTLCFEHPLHGLMEITANSIEVSVEGSEHWEEARTYVLGTGLALAALLNGRVPYHMSSVALNGRALAFTGDSGAGKTTWAGLIMKHFGARLLTDDMAFVHKSADGLYAQITGGMKRLRLREDSVELLDAKKTNRDFQSRIESYDYEGASETVKVGALIKLVPGYRATELKRISKAETFEALRYNQFRRDYGDLIMGGTTMAAHALELTRVIDCFEFHYELGAARIQDNLDCLAKNLLQPWMISTSA